MWSDGRLHQRKERVLDRVAPLRQELRLPFCDLPRVTRRGFQNDLGILSGVTRYPFHTICAVVLGKTARRFVLLAYLTPVRQAVRDLWSCTCWFLSLQSRCADVYRVTAWRVRLLV